ncbi:MAG: response regulator transcription factor [Chloroflexi bacterium]|nr:response regulator transcription factor [Chloroflexota bacterium]
MAKILVVDDERTLVETIRYNLLREGHDVCAAYDGVEAIEVARNEKPDAIVLDVMLPIMDGLEVCRTLRKDMIVPIIMLTAKDDEVDKVVGLELGADDYMTKPFSMRELLARLKAVLRRAQMLRQEAALGQDGSAAEPLVVGALHIDFRQHSVTLKGKQVPLKPKEFDLLAFLVAHKGQVLTREQLLERVWGYDYAGETRTVDVHVRGLREKIEANPSEPRLIETVRGVGYRFAG